MGISGCENNRARKTVTLSKTEKIYTAQQKPAEGVIRIAVGGMLTPREGFAYYRKLLAAAKAYGEWGYIQ